MMNVFVGVLFDIILTVLAAWVVCTLSSYCLQKRIKKRLAENDIESKMWERIKKWEEEHRDEEKG